MSKAAAADRCGRGDLAFADSGSLEFWDSNGGSFSTGVKMGNPNQQWPWFAILVKTRRTCCWKMPVTSAFAHPAKIHDAGPIEMKEVEVPLYPGYLCSADLNAHKSLAGADDTGGDTDRGRRQNTDSCREEEMLPSSAQAGADWRFHALADTCRWDMSPGSRMGLCGV